MKRVSFITGIILFSALATAILASCDGPTMNGGTTSGGKPYELIVAVEHAQWESEVADSLRSVFREPMPMLNQVEPMFDMTRVLPSSLKGLVLQHRNILVVRVDPEIKKPSSVAQYDTYSKPQVIVTVVAPDNRSMAGYISENREALHTIFENAERDRSVSWARKYNVKAAEQEIFETFGMNMSIPQGYKFRKKVGDDFVWISNEHAHASQGIAIYSYPYSGKDDFLQENLERRRDEFVSRIPGPSPGSYMITSEYFETQVRYMRIYGRSWAEMRGLWDVRNDFMGGPFVSYTTLDVSTGRVITLDFYVYAPKDDKRNFMRSLEHLVYTVSFPGNNGESAAD